MLTPRVPEGTALVGDFNDGATLFRKGGPRLESSNSHDTYFRQNKIAIRAEVRLDLRGAITPSSSWKSKSGREIRHQRAKG